MNIGMLSVLTKSKNFRIPSSAHNGVEVLVPLNVISLKAVFCSVRIRWVTELSHKPQIWHMYMQHKDCVENVKLRVGIKWQSLERAPLALRSLTEIEETWFFQLRCSSRWILPIKMFIKMNTKVFNRALSWTLWMIGFSLDLEFETYW